MVTLIPAIILYTWLAVFLGIVLFLVIGGMRSRYNVKKGGVMITRDNHERIF